MKRHTRIDRHQSELLCAATRYCAVADWFESPAGRRAGPGAINMFNQIEGELRKAGAKALRKNGHRALVLQAVGIPEALR